VTAVSVSRIDISCLGHGQDLGRGGQGQVTAVSGALIDGRWAAVLKTYSRDVARALDTNALEMVVGFPGTIQADDRHWLLENTAWPAVIAEDQGNVRGFLMRVVPTPYYFNFRTQTQGAVQKLADAAFLLNSDRYVSSSGLSVSDHDRLALLENLAAALSRLHRLGVVVGDLSPKNLLFSLTPSPSCFLIDCDAMLVRGRTVLPQVQTPDWEVPVGEPTATSATDAYKFGLLAIRLFARDQSSHDQMALAMVSAELGRLAAASQHQDPSRRPAPETWVSVLAAARQALPQGKAPAAPATPWRRPSVLAAPVPAATGPARTYPPPVPNRPKRGSRHAAAKILGTAAAVALVALVTVVGLHAGHPASPSAGTPAFAGQTSSSGQAAQVNNLLNSSAASRKSLIAAVQNVDDCTNVTSAVSALSGVTGQREDEYTQAAALSTGDLRNGSALKSDLVSAMRYSFLADQDFLSWAREELAVNCGSSVSATNSYSAGVSASADAVTAKNEFVSLWNPIARTQGYPARSQDGI
jgi:hypothetical protein